MRSIALLVAVLAPIGVCAAQGQVARDHPSVRVHAPSVAPRAIEGRAERAGDTLVLAMEGGARLRVPLSAVTRMEARVGLSRGRGALRGLVVGALFGGLAGAIVPLDDCGPDGVDPDKLCTRTEAVGFSAIGFGAIGGLVGAFFPIAVWREVSPTSVSVAPMWHDGRLAGGALGVRLALDVRR